MNAQLNDMKKAIVIAAVMVCSTSHAVQGASSAALTNFSYSLEDITVDSSANPSLSINYGGNVDQRVLVSHGPPVLFNPNANVLIWSLGGNNISALASDEKTFSADKVLGTQTLENVGFAAFGNGVVSAGSTLYAETSPFDRNSVTDVTHFEQWTLSGQTKMTLSGSIVLEASVDASQLPADLSGYWNSVKVGVNQSYPEYITSTGSVDLRTFASLNLGFYALNGDGSRTNIELPVSGNSINSNWQFSIDAKQTAYASGERPSNQLTNSLVIPFEVTLINAGTDAAVFGMDASLLTTAGITVNAIPEPSTYALMLLGLGGLAAAVRRQQRRATTH